MERSGFSLRQPRPGDVEKTFRDGRKVHPTQKKRNDSVCAKALRWEVSSKKLGKAERRPQWLQCCKQDTWAAEPTC